MEFMFFRREKPSNPSFSDRMDSLRKSGFAVTQRGAGLMRVTRGAFAVDLKDVNNSVHGEGRAGIAMGDEIGSLIDGGYQKFFRTPSGKQKPALADELKGLHDFEEDVKEALGQESYYNESLGTVSTFYLYDRVQNRDTGVPKRVWDNA
jgi:hypothetical protein